MLSYLKNTNPSDKWLKYPFSLELQLNNGHSLILKMRDSWDFRFTEKTLREYVGASCPISDVSNVVKLCNEQIEAFYGRICWHGILAEAVLSLIAQKNYKEAMVQLEALADKLLDFKSTARGVWGSWCEAAYSAATGKKL